MTRNPNMREAILSAAELLFSTHGFNAVSIRDIALEAGANPGSITYHFKSKDGLLLEIYKRHCGPMNKRRIELLVAARRVRDVQDRLEAIVRAYVQPAFSSSSDLAGGGARFTRLRAVMSAEGNAVVGRIIAEIFDDTTNAFIEAIEESLPHLPRKTIVWRSQFLLGALYYTLVNPERVTRLSRGEADGADMAEAIEQLVAATVASLQAPDVDQSTRPRSLRRPRQSGQQSGEEHVRQRRKEDPAGRSSGNYPAQLNTAEGTMHKPTIPGPDPDTRTPKFKLPALACDAHTHIFGPGDKYPYAPGRPYTPPDAPLEDFRALHRKLGIGRAVIVNASVHGTDNRVALDAIAVSNGTFRAVANIDDTITERGLRELHEGGFRGCRFNFVRHLGGVPDMAVFHRIVAMVAPLGWHIDLHFDAIDLPEYAEMLAKLPVRYTIDHMGRVKAADGLDQLPFRTLIDLMTAGREMLGQGVRLRAGVVRRTAVPRRGAVRAPHHRDRAGSRDLGNRLAASQCQGDAE